MEFKKLFLWGISCVLSIICSFIETAYAKSVYAVSINGSSTVQVYEVDGSRIEYQFTTANFPHNGYGCVGLAIDPNSCTLFASYDDSAKIELVNSRTMLTVSGKAISPPAEIAGMDFDVSNSRLLAMKRQGNKLYIYDFDRDTRSLTLDITTQLQNIDPFPNGAYGIRLDEVDRRLYVSDATNIVKYYNDVSSPGGDPNYVYSGGVEIEIDGENEKAVGIAVYNDNNGTNYLYAGGYDHTNYHNYLIRVDLNIYADNPDDPNSIEYEDIGACVIGVDVDQDTGLVYITTTDNTIQVWDTDVAFGLGLGKTDYETEGIDGPADICIGQPGFELPFGIEKEDDLSQNQCVIREDEITYTICYNYQWTQEGDPELNAFTSITIVDYLPKEVDFVLADPCDGTYAERPTHTYTWTIYEDSIGDPNCLELTVKINKNITPGEPVENSVVEIIASIEGEEYIDKDTTETTACDCSEFGTVLYVDKDVVAEEPDGLSWETAFDDLADAMNAAWPCDQIWVAKGTYTPEIMSEPNMYFDMAKYVSLLGGFWGDENESYERNWADPCNETVLSGDLPGDEDLDYVVNINVERALVDGFTIKDGSLAGVYCEDGTVVLEHNKITSNEKGIYCNDTENSIIRNNLIYENQYGIYLKNTVETKIVNNTLVDNSSAGIYSETSIEPYISSCIIWEDAETNDIVDCNAIYSCLTDGSAGQGNIDGDPNYPPFVIGDDYYHLDPCSGPGSACIDAGDPNGSYGGERDIDKHFRVLDGGVNGKIVDMGADEYCNETSSNEADFNEDSIVNYIDFAIFGKAWLSDPCDDNWNVYCDLVANNIIDVNDLTAFAQEWLWMSCDAMKDIPMMETMMMGMCGGMGRMGGAESMLMAEQQAESQQSYSEPTIEEQIAQIKRLLDFWLREDVREELEDKEAWLGLVTDLEEMLKELEDSQ